MDWWFRPESIVSHAVVGIAFSPAPESAFEQIRTRAVSSQIEVVQRYGAQLACRLDICCMTGRQSFVITKA